MAEVGLVGEAGLLYCASLPLDECCSGNGSYGSASLD